VVDNKKPRLGREVTGTRPYAGQQPAKPAQPNLSHQSKHLRPPSGRFQLSASAPIPLRHCIYTCLGHRLLRLRFCPLPFSSRQAVPSRLFSGPQPASREPCAPSHPHPHNIPNLVRPAAPTAGAHDRVAAAAIPAPRHAVLLSRLAGLGQSPPCSGASAATRASPPSTRSSRSPTSPSTSCSTSPTSSRSSSRKTQS
jgi:hypothetical protein